MLVSAVFRLLDTGGCKLRFWRPLISYSYLCRRLAWPASFCFFIWSLINQYNEPKEIQDINTPLPALAQGLYRAAGCRNLVIAPFVAEV